ncbi:unnamed protein product [Coffea canephora]|uniref:Secreted protein n=1 Tax=Coffea canephora TaxID=49390 RepID=A0A068UX23_COFCA|nr:unnamed protein product [Coffea canephora]
MPDNHRNFFLIFTVSFFLLSGICTCRHETHKFFHRLSFLPFGAFVYDKEKFKTCLLFSSSHGRHTNATQLVFGPKIEKVLQ